MLSITDLKVGVKILDNDEPYLITKYSQTKKARGGSVVKVQIKNLITGSSLSKTFQGNDKVEEADVSRGSAQLSYIDGENYNFMDNETYDQFALTKEQLGDAVYYIIEGSDLEVLKFRDNPVNVELKPKVELKVIETPPGVKGDTAAGGNKPATLETGLVVQVPLFIKNDDIVRVNTETGEYVERVS